MATLSEFPNSISAGDSLTVAYVAPECPASEWTLSFAGVAGTASIASTATGSGTTHTFSVTPTASALWTPGSYVWRIYASKIGVRETLATGVMAVLPNLAAGLTESHARKTLRLIQAAIEGRVDEDMEGFSLEGESIQMIPLERLSALRGIYAGMVATEDRQLAGQGGARIHRVRFTQPV